LLARHCFQLCSNRLAARGQACQLLLKALSARPVLSKQLAAKIFDGGAQPGFGIALQAEQACLVESFAVPREQLIERGLTIIRGIH
jgi:hypothetical protein